MSTTQNIINPADLSVCATVEFLDVEEVDELIHRAHHSYPSWRAMTPHDRKQLLSAFASEVRAHSEELAEAEMRSAGHPIASARGEAIGVADVIEYFAGFPERHFGRQIPVAGGIDVTFREPLGVVGVIVPWNFPMLIASWGFAPALAAGNTVVLKPAEATPLSALILERLALDAGFPEGVFQVAPGRGDRAGWRLVTNELVKKVCFTGSTRVGKQIMAGCAEQMKRVTLELGGKSANIIFGDADVEAAAKAAPFAVFDNAGQDCCARSRLLVDRAIYDDFLPIFLEATASIVVGDPLDDRTQMGPLISAEQLARVQGYVAEAEVIYQVPNVPATGYYFAPTVLSGADTTAPSCREEIFGPVVSIVPFDTEAEALQIANDSIYGLSGSIWTRDLSRAFRVVRQLESGNLSVNSNSSVRYSTPFGGFKGSGIGRELGPDALDAFTELKNVFIAIEEEKG
ncbi:aldehyde dehydrogenase family protein [Ferrimicrobium sp.]|uniref:aldehyde dehydrogenase family protein n=1 Tax=Ferrimicrobium sp. TaxID=2926050 RepID=UPI0026016981|nr:aldehyde dehydrogenase family protein [Ferrimicrobium sp.]